MNITPKEKLMYQVMKVIYENKIPIDFKGSLALKAYLMEKGYIEETRHTMDIDGNWNSNTLPTAEQMKKMIQNALDENNLDLEIRLYRMYGEKRSAGFEVLEKEKIIKIYRFWSHYEKI